MKLHAVQIALLLTILAATFAQPSSGAVKTSNPIPSAGSIIYSTYTTNRLLGVDQFNIYSINQTNLNVMHQYGANAFRETAYMGDWTSSSYKTKIVQVNQWAKSLNMSFILGCTGTQWEPTEGFDQMLANAIYNSTARANWISIYGDMIRQIQPYGVNPMNEPPVIADTSYGSSVTQAQFIKDYKNFVIACIDAWTQIKPGLVFVVEGSPFYDIASILNSPRIDQSRPSTTIYYSTHYHYSYENVDPNTWGYKDDAQQGYWNAANSADLANAKTALYNNFLHNDGISTAISLGLNIIFEEVGGNIKNPNVLAFEQDLFDFAKAYNISVLWHSWGTSGTFGIGLLTDWTPKLNPMGTVWSQNMH
jgi:hypothetical protein